MTGKYRVRVNKGDRRQSYLQTVFTRSSSKSQSGMSSERGGESGRSTSFDSSEGGGISVVKLETLVE